MGARSLPTLEWVKRLFKVRELAQRVAEKLRTTVSGFIYQQIWRGANVERWAGTAAEGGRHKAKYFTWLCKHHGPGQALDAARWSAWSAA